MADHPVSISRIGDQILVEIGPGAVLLNVSDIERLHTDLERAVAAVVADRREHGR